MLYLYVRNRQSFIHRALIHLKYYCTIRYACAVFTLTFYIVNTCILHAAPLRSSISLSCCSFTQTFVLINSPWHPFNRKIETTFLKATINYIVSKGVRHLSTCTRVPHVHCLEAVAHSRVAVTIVLQPPRVAAIVPLSFSSVWCM